MTWSIPTKGTTISVNSFLPTGVGSSGNAFTVAVSPVSITRRLGDDCSACQLNDGRVIPKPAFTGVASTTAPLPSSVTSAVLGNNTVAVTLRHSYAFDPLRPSATAREMLKTLVALGEVRVEGQRRGTSYVSTLAAKVEPGPDVGVMPKQEQFSLF